MTQQQESKDEILPIKPELFQSREVLSTQLYAHPSEQVLFSYFSIMRKCAEKAYQLNIKQYDRELVKSGQSMYPHTTEEIFESVCVVNELLERVPCISKYPSVLAPEIEGRRSEFLQDLNSCAEFKTTPDLNKFKLFSHDEVLTRNNHLVQKYDQLLEQDGSITRFPTLYNHLNNSGLVDHSKSVHQLVKKLNLEEPVKEISKDLQSSSPNMVSLVYNLSTAFCREQILDCIKKSTAKTLDRASFVNLSTCLGGSCTSKVLEYLSEKSREA